MEYQFRQKAEQAAEFPWRTLLCYLVLNIGLKELFSVTARGKNRQLYFSASWTTWTELKWEGGRDGKH